MEELELWKKFQSKMISISTK